MIPIIFVFLQSCSAITDNNYGYNAPTTNTPIEEQKNQGTTLTRTELYSGLFHTNKLPYTTENNDLFDGESIDVREALLYTDSACHDSEPKCGKVHLLYLNDTRDVAQVNYGKGEADSWDREHVWPASIGFKGDKYRAYSDLHHIRPADRNLNGVAGHWDRGYSEGGSIVYDTLVNGVKIRTDAKIDKDAHTFEPPNRAKGQVARMLFYMDVRYEGNDPHTPNLKLENNHDRNSLTTLGNLCELLAWHHEFPPTGFERRRNNRVEEIQGNRNPFIDYPELADQIWGEDCTLE